MNFLIKIQSHYSVVCSRPLYEIILPRPFSDEGKLRVRSAIQGQPGIGAKLAAAAALDGARVTQSFGCVSLLYRVRENCARNYNEYVINTR